MDAVIAPRREDCRDTERPEPLPANAPLPMPVQSLLQSPRAAAVRSPAAWRRVLIMGATAVLSAAGIYEMYQVLQVGGITVLEGVVLVLFAALFAWVALSFVSALAGFTVLCCGWRDDVGIMPDGSMPAVSSKIAMLLPTYNEDAPVVFARLQATRQSVDETGRGAQFDWFVLSDSTDPSVWIDEERCYAELAATHDRLYYRHRPHNTARKSGNIADWVERFGGTYDFMVILDADSVMTGDVLVRIAPRWRRTATSD